MEIVCLLLFGLFLTPMGGAQDGEWTGFVNQPIESLDFSCPDNLALSGVASDFFSAHSDRQWEFQCTSAGGLANVSLSCTLQTSINTLQTDLNFDCPNDGYLAGFVSQFDTVLTDREWRPYCCTRPFATVIKCQKPGATWENVLRQNLNFTTPGDQVIAGVESFYFNGDRRWRFRTCEVEVDCGDPGTPDNGVRDGDNFLYNSTVTFTCNHGHYQSSGPVGGVRRCLESGLWSDQQPVCTACTPIANCADIRCTNGSDHMCEECQSNTGPANGEMAYTNLGTQCQARCSWLTTFCYPGLCEDELSSCNCTMGFEGQECLEISESPDVMSCDVTIEGEDGSDVTLPCQPNTTTPLYTNIAPYQLTGQWSVVYIAPTPLPPPPAYVDSFAVGVAISELRATLYRAANPQTPVSMTTHACNDSVSPDAPISGVVTCLALATPTNLSDHTFLHGDTFEVELIASAGGHLDILDLDNPPDVQRHYYAATPTVEGVVFILDLQPPTHCSLVMSANCLANQEILRLSGDIVTTNEIAVSWGGWLDNPSGIVSYDISVYYLEYVNGYLTEGALLESNQTLRTSQVMYDYNVSLPAEGPYSFILQSHDLAGNTRYSRQALLYDFNSSVEIDLTVPLTVTSAVPATGHLWQNTTETIVISGLGHFYNTNLRMTNYLAPLDNFTLGGSVSAEFDQALSTGRYPREGTRNALGIVDVSYDVIVDHMGGNSTDGLMQPDMFPFQTTDIEIEGVEIATPIQDGDSVQIWFQATDFRFQYAVDSVLVHIDSSAPEMNDLALAWNGVTGLSLHGTGSLLDLDVRFQAYDEHSGIFSVEWSIETVYDSQVVGNGGTLVPMLDPAYCTVPDCICDPLNHCTPQDFSIRPLAGDFSDPLALHDTDYIVTVTVTNHALLSTTLSHRFTVDTTPPLQGHVNDGNRSHDLDYQTTLDLTTQWSGFFDRETDVAFYQYTFGTICSNSSVFMYPLPTDSQVVQTVETMATWTAMVNSTYYVTVVAFNQALQPSPPVCSDGITVDMVAPVIQGVTIPDAVVVPGLVRSVDGDVWYVRSDRVRLWVGDCPDLTTDEQDLSAYPIGDGSPPSDVCTTSPMFLSLQPTYLTSDHTLNISWYPTDNIGIARHEVSITNDTVDYSDVQYHHTAGQSHYSFHESELLSNGNQFYLSVRVTDFAEQLTVVDIGPIVVDVTPPIVNGTLSLERNGDYGIVSWTESTFQDQESGLMSFQVAIGRTYLGDQILPFGPIQTPRPVQCSTYWCTAVDLSSLPLFSGLQYYVTIKATNGAGLTSYISSSFIHSSDLPTLGYVLDIDPTLSFNLTSDYNAYNRDIDFLVDTDLLGVRWGSFVHQNLPINYSVGLGTQVGIDNVVPLTSVGMATEYEFSNVTLDSGLYYCIVVAENTVGRVNVSSNGVRVLKGVAESLVYAQVFDGQGPVDVDYQASKSVVSAHWEFPSMISAYVSQYEWSLLQDGTAITPYKSIGKDTTVLSSVYSLEEGLLYVAAVRACFYDNCLEPVLSNGFQVSIPPRAGSIRAVYTPALIDEEYGVSVYGNLDLSWEAFEGPQITRYEWSIGNGDVETELLVYWTESYELSVQVSLNATISLHRLNYVNVRGYNSAGLYSTSSELLEWNVNNQTVPQRLVPRNPLSVYDVPASDVPVLHTDNWKDLEHVTRTYIDIDYTNQTSSLSAVWPDLRYQSYSYSLSTRQQYEGALCKSEPENPACGVTIGNGATVTNFDLVDGKRYYFCVEAYIDDVIHQTLNTPPVVSVCSNGITVDQTPPTSGCVQVVTISVNESEGSGSGSLIPVPDDLRCSDNGLKFVVSTSELFVVWAEFKDVETLDNAVHVTGVRDFQYAVGTAPGASNVVDFTSIGVATYAVLRDLSLESGLTYYVTIRAMDFVGHLSDGYSQAVTVDTTSPDLGRVWIEGSSSFDKGLTLAWDRPMDKQSGIVGMEWGLGTRMGSCDVLEWRPVDVLATRQVVDSSQLYDGLTVFLFLKVTNGAGLTTISSSLAYTLDHTPPSLGLVYDGPYITSQVRDLDYTTDLSMLSSHWSRFTDPHSDVVEYFVAMGTVAGGTDIQETISVGMATAHTVRYLTLSHGQTYYTTITACNSLRLCSSVSSNGITADVTPPTPGRVLNGPSAPDVQFQASTTTLSAHWTGFHDHESGILYFEYFIGFSPYQEGVVNRTRAPSTQTSFVTPSPVTLLTNSTLYTTVVAVNGAGVKVQVTSRGVYIDDTPPQVVAAVTIDTEWVGSVDMATQFSTSAIRCQWSYDDSLTSVNHHFWSLLSRSNTRVLIPGRTVGSQSSTTAANLGISDGDTHQVLLIGCNQAGLCTESLSQSVLFDSSPPIDGYFAVSSSSTAMLNRTVPGGMTWRNRNLRDISQLNIAFLGFRDPHSRVTEYLVSVGTWYGASDLMPSLQPEMVVPLLASDDRGVYIALVELNRVLVETELLYVSLTAVNGVGLKSHTVQGTFSVDPQTVFNNNGTLTLLRSSTCPIASCVRHCTCGARGQLCDFGAVPPCDQIDPSTLPTNRQLNIRAVSPQLAPGANDSTLYTALTDKLVAEWELVDPTSMEIRYLEWSVSEEEFPPGVGVAIDDGVWMSVNAQSPLVFSSARPLKQGVAYVFYIRAWFSNTSFAVFESNSITVDTVGMETVLGGRVRVANGNRFTSTADQVTISLDNVFITSLSGSLATYQVAIGDSIHGDNVLPYTPVTLGTTTLSNFDLLNDRTYYVTAQAVSPLGVITTSSSLPLTVDQTTPTSGHMTTGTRTHDILAQTNSTLYTARWLGFTSPVSGIHHYELALTQSLTTPPISEYSNVGIALRGQLHSLSLTEGETYFPHLVAVSAAGVRSEDFVVTRGLVVDSTLPIGLSVEGENLLSNPSFEGNSSECLEYVDTAQVTQYWTLYGLSTVLTVYTYLPYDGCNTLLFSGTLSQSLTTQFGVWYRLSVAASRYGSTEYTQLVMSAAGASSTCEVTDSVWFVCDLIFQACENVSTVQLSTLTELAMVVDVVSVIALNDYSQARNGDSSIANDPSNTVRLDHIGHANSRLHIHWLIADPESGVREFQFAVGTVRGGQQKQTYRSTGTNNFAVTDLLSFGHGERVYVSVAATNFAGLTHLFYSDQVVVDHTAPDINGTVWDGDRQCQTEYVVWANWSLAIGDQESDLLSCLWALGTSPGATDIQPFIVMSSGVTSAHSNNLSPHITDGTTVFSTVICLNRAGRYSNVYSDGVTILTAPPDSSHAYLRITSPRLQQYDIIDGYLPSNNVTLTWNGFVAPNDSPLTYQVRLIDASYSTDDGGWLDEELLLQLTVNNLTLPSNTSVVQVRSVNCAGQSSEPVTQSIAILTDPPEITGSVNYTWLTDGKQDQLHLNWTDTFYSPAPLRYELSVGTVRGSGSIAMWMEFSSLQTTHTLTHKELEQTRDYYLSLIAISASGLPVIHNQDIASSITT